MFTGIVEEIGLIQKIDKRGQAMVITVAAQKIVEDIHLGDSIAVNGVCLTVIQYDRRSFSVDVMPETFRQTNLVQLNIGSRVNLERAMSVQSRFGGHIVQGHVDGTGKVILRQAEENAVVFTIEPESADMLKYIIPRGSIAIDGISLTVVRVQDRSFSVSIIPHTLAQTILNEKRPGDSVNLESDILGKYIDHLLLSKDAYTGGSNAKPGITVTYLAEHGFI